MKAFLTSISLLLCLLTYPLSSVAQEISTDAGSDSASTREYNLFMQIRGREVSSICILSMSADSTIAGTIVNEFGVKVFDVTYDGKKAKVLNVLGPLNKWYIRMVLNKDFTFILDNIDSTIDVTRKKRKLTIQPNGDMVFSNNRFKISYTFTPIKRSNEIDK